MKYIYKMKIGERIRLDDSSTVIITRVPGGWVFSSQSGTCFIPFSYEGSENE